MKRRTLCIVILFAVLFTVACGPKKDANETPTTPTTVPATATPAPATDTPTPTATVTPTEIPVTPMPTEEVINNNDIPETDGRYRIELSGNKDDRFQTTRYCYIESEKYFLLLDKDLNLPGDFTTQMDLLIDTLEEVTGLSYIPDFKPDGFDNSTVRFGFNPWRDMEFGDKIPIFIFVDREGKNLISYASEMYTVFISDELTSEEVWNSIPSFRDNPYRRHSFIDYSSVAHELVHTITLRHGFYTKIMTEGCADYFAEKALKKLSSRSNDFAESINNYVLFSSVEDEITPQNAEQIFREDYLSLSHANRDDEYTLGRLICKFLEETYGDSFFTDYVKGVNEAGFQMAANGVYYQYSPANAERQAEVFKSVFGDDVFTKFGAWYQKQQ